MNQKIGPYEIIRRLGEGGMGTVDLARHMDTGQTVAIKRVTHLSGALLDALRREVWSLAKIQHPNIVRIHDHDLEAETPWYAMEFIEGASLRERLHNTVQRTAIFDSAETQIFETLVSVDLTTLATPQDLDQVEDYNPTRKTRPLIPRAYDWLELVRSMTDVCAGLSALHEAGIIHRDLKPENILFRESGEAVIVDFGISMLALGANGRERLTRMLRGSGTPAYLSPEQALSRPIDARADLYSLGIILFEIATGTVPFDHESLVHVLHDHVYTAPPRTGDLNPDIATDLDALIAQLLSKRPSQRLGFAFDVDLALRRALGMAHPSYTPPAYVYAPDLVGRDDALQQLSDMARNIKRRGTDSMLIRGDAGVGKTRLILEFIQTVGHELPIHIGSGQQGSQAPFLAFFSVWLSLAEQDSKAANEVQAHYLPWWNEIWSGQRPVDRTDIPIAMKLLADLSNQSQRLVILDDAQWLDPWSETLLEHLLASPPKGLGLIILTREKNAGFECTQEIALEPLTRDQTTEMMKSMVGREAIADPYVDFAFRESNGNPFILAEMARMAMRERIIYRDQAGIWHVASEKIFQTADIPASKKIVATFEEQLKSLEPDLRDGLHWCACIGGATDPRLLRSVAPGVNPQRLVESSLMYWDGLRLRFEQTMLSRVLYDQMDGEERAQKHLKIAHTLCELSEINPFVLGRHFFRAGAIELAEPYLWQAYQQAARVGLMKDALKYFDFWVRSGTVYDTAFWGRVLEVLDTEIWRSSDLYANTCRYLVDAAEGCVELGTRTIIYAHYLLGIRDETMEHKQEWIEKTLTLAKMCESPRAKFTALKSVRMALNFDTEKVIALLQEMMEIAPLISTDDYVNVLIDYARTLQYSTRYDEARAVLVQARLISENEEIRFRVRYELVISTALLEGECGNPELALQMYRGITEELKRHAADRDIAFHYCNLAQQLIALKRYDEAQVESERADVICGYLPYHQVRGLIVLHQVEIAEMRGDISGAHRVFGRGETVFNHPKLRGFRFNPYWKYSRARFLRRTGDVEGSLKFHPSLGVEPYLDACILAEQGFVALHHGENADAIIEAFEKLTRDVGFPALSEPGQLLAALKRSAAARPEERIHGEFILDFPPKLLAALKR